MDPRSRPICSDCEAPVDRRTFIRTVGSAALVGAAGPALLGGRFAQAAPTTKSAAETAVGRFYGSLSEAQKSAIVLPFDHELRQKINANWHITKPTLDDDFYSNEQRALVHEILRSVTTEDGYARILRQTEDDSGGIGGYSMAVFGTPGAGKFEWEITGRHLTLRADGDSVDKAAFGGPIIYGHGAEQPKDNLFHYQTKKANEVFHALDAKQAAKALLTAAPKEAEVALQGDKGAFPGIAIGELSADQKQLVESTLKIILAPYRKEDVDEVFEILKTGGGVEKLHMAFYQEGDLQDDKVWDIWRVEGPSFVWHFRGAPHVHAYINIGVKT
ncbi:MAG TPA: DUF3500 domain-containing protein [Planctomycetaceae bacterium]|nr:DUF3500 domain-containing protein [Planctomycetaceae bacterium]